MASVCCICNSAEESVTHLLFSVHVLGGFGIGLIERQVTTATSRLWIVVSFWAESIGIIKQGWL